MSPPILIEGGVYDVVFKGEELLIKHGFGMWIT